jgi:hypothetical protein
MNRVYLGYRRRWRLLLCVADGTTFPPNKKAIPVEIVARNNDYGVVTLPSRSFEGPNVARVPSDALRFA